MIRAGLPTARTTLATPCAAVAALLMLTDGCLMPQSVDPRETTPHTIPRVDLKLLRDYELKPVMLLYPRGPGDVSAGCHCLLQVEIASIIAENPTVDIEGRLFVDYDVAVPSSERPISVPIKDPGDFQSTKTNRGPFVLPIDADAIGLTEGFHVFELVTAEREGFALNDNVFPPQRATNLGWESSVFKFVVNVRLQADPLRPTCDVGAAPPQVRLCSP